PVRFLFAIAPASTSDLRSPELAAASDQSPAPARPTSAQARAFQPGRTPACPALRPRRGLSREPDEAPHRELWRAVAPDRSRAGSRPKNRSGPEGVSSWDSP